MAYDFPTTIDRKERMEEKRRSRCRSKSFVPMLASKEPVHLSHDHESDRDMGTANGTVKLLFRLLGCGPSSSRWKEYLLNLVFTGTTTTTVTVFRRKDSTPGLDGVTFPPNFHILGSQKVIIAIKSSEQIGLPDFCTRRRPERWERCERRISQKDRISTFPEKR